MKSITKLRQDFVAMLRSQRTTSIKKKDIHLFILGVLSIKIVPEMSIYLHYRGYFYSLSDVIRVICREKVTSFYF